MNEISISNVKSVALFFKYIDLVLICRLYYIKVSNSIDEQKIFRRKIQLKRHKEMKQRRTVSTKLEQNANAIASIRLANRTIKVSLCLISFETSITSFAFFKVNRFHIHSTHKRITLFSKKKSFFPLALHSALTFSAAYSW